MEQEYNSYEEQKPVSPFANSPYESVYSNLNTQTVVKKPKKSRKGLIAILLVLVLVAGCFVTALGVNGYWGNKFTELETKTQQQLKLQEEKINTILSGVGTGENAGNQDLGLVYAKNVQAVVAISNQAVSTNFYGQVSETASSGSGFIISEDGYVVSNYHVVQGATKLTVITANSEKYDATLVGFDATNDLAVLKINGTDLPYVKLGSSDELVVGNMVAAIGNPLGELTSTLTVGYISAKDRIVNTDGTYLNMLQTDAAINSGNSGGPLFNMNGEVVGITTAKYTGTSGSGAMIEGIGFAIPIDDVKGMITDLVDKGYVSSAYLGVIVKDIDRDVADTYGLPSGVLVDSVEAGSAAELAGIQEKDIIVGVGEDEVTTVAELSRVLRKFEPGQTAKVYIYRSGNKLELDITFAEKPAQTQQQEEATQPTEQQQQIPNFGGFEDWFGGFFPGFGGFGG